MIAKRQKIAAGTEEETIVQLNKEHNELVAKWNQIEARKQKCMDRINILSQILLERLEEEDKSVEAARELRADKKEADAEWFKIKQQAIERKDQVIKLARLKWNNSCIKRGNKWMMIHCTSSFSCVDFQIDYNGNVYFSNGKIVLFNLFEIPPSEWNSEFMWKSIQRNEQK